MSELHFFFVPFNVDFSASAPTAVISAHNEKSLGLSAVDKLFQTSLQPGGHDLGRDMRLVCVQYDIVTILGIRFTTLWLFRPTVS